MYFHFEFFAGFPSLQLAGAPANEIEHDHLPVDIVVLDPRYKALYIYGHIVALTHVPTVLIFLYSFLQCISRLL